MEKSISKKIKSFGRAIFGLLVVFFIFSIVRTISSVYVAVKSYSGVFFDALFLNDSIQVLHSCLETLMLVLAAVIFFRIANNETPFIKSVSNPMKLFAVIYFLSVALPPWCGYIIFSIMEKRFIFELFGNQNSPALLVAIIVFCLAQIFEYGCALQEENYGIL